MLSVQYTCTQVEVFASRKAPPDDHSVTNMLSQTQVLAGIVTYISVWGMVKCGSAFKLLVIPVIVHNISSEHEQCFFGDVPAFRSLCTSTSSFWLTTFSNSWFSVIVSLKPFSTYLMIWEKWRIWIKCFAVIRNFYAVHCTGPNSGG